MGRYQGRGALSNPPPRFMQSRTESVDEGWYQEELPDSIATEVRAEPARSIIARNDSPDISFEQSINPYRGCEHGCVYCLGRGTPVLMADGSARPIEELRVGDAIYGTERQGWYRRYVTTRVLARWSVIKPAYRVTLEDGTELVAGADHRFLTERGWKFVIAAARGPQCRPYLTAGNRLMGTGAFAVAPARDIHYRRGYLCGLIGGGGLPAEGSYRRSSQVDWQARRLRPAPCDQEALQRAADWVECVATTTQPVLLAAGAAERRELYATCTQGGGTVARIRELIAWPSDRSRVWQAGFLSGNFDAQGSYSDGILRISNTDAGIVQRLRESLECFGFKSLTERLALEHRGSVHTLRLQGGLREHLRFFHTVDPCLKHKCNITGQAVKSASQLDVVSIEPLGTMRLYDITTGTEDFIANGFVSHNCYARPSHAYVDLSPGIDFETKIFYKADAARLLEQELSRPGYTVKPITLGANTDPYQPLERQLRVTRSILEVLERARHPLSIVTKGALILRDRDLLSSLARDDLVRVFVSVTTLDAELKRTLEPRAASPQARLRVLRELSAAGIPTGVLVAPVIPALNDCEVKQIIAAVAAAGAMQAGYVLLRLPHELKQLFRQWLEEHLPQRAEHVMALIRATRDGRENAPRFGSRMVGSGPWAQLLRDRFALACRRHGLPTGQMRALSTAHFRMPVQVPQMRLPL